MRSGEIPADDELLSPIQTIFDPSAAPLFRLVVAFLLLSDDSLKTLLADRSEEVPWRSLDQS